MNKLIVPFYGLLFVHTLISMQLVSEVTLSTKDNNQMLKKSHQFNSQKCLLCIQSEIYEKELTACFCGWKSKRQTVAIPGLIMHIAKNHFKIKVGEYWGGNLVCLLCQRNIQTQSGMTNHLILQHLENILVHINCEKSESVNKKRKCENGIQDSTGKEKSFDTFELYKRQPSIQDNDKQLDVREVAVENKILGFKNAIAQLHAISSFCLLCTQKIIKAQCISENSKQGSAFEQRKKRLQMMLISVKRHDLYPKILEWATTDVCGICSQAFSNNYRTYHHVIFGHVLNAISHKSLTGNCDFEMIDELGQIEEGQGSLSEESFAEYEKTIDLVAGAGFEPATFGL